MQDNSFNVESERFDEIRILRYQVPDFETLPLNHKILIYPRKEGAERIAINCIIYWYVQLKRLEKLNKYSLKMILNIVCQSKKQALVIQKMS